MLLVYILLATAFLYYAGIPAFVYFTFKQPVPPHLRPFDITMERLEEKAKVFFVTARARLENDGFLHQGYLLFENTQDMKSYMSIFYHPGSRTRAFAGAVVMLFEGKEKLRSTSMEFSTKYANGFALGTNNNPDFAPAVQDPDRKTEGFAAVTDSRALYRLHLSLAESYSFLRSIPPPEPLDLVAELRAYSERDMAFNLRVGTARMTRDGRFLRITVFGAVNSCWALLWPFGALYRRKQSKRARAILASLGAEQSSPSSGAIPMEKFHLEDLSKEGGSWWDWLFTFMLFWGLYTWFTRDPSAAGRWFHLGILWIGLIGSIVSPIIRSQRKYRKEKG